MMYTDGRLVLSMFVFFLYCNNNELYDYVLNRIFGVRENKNLEESAL